jgi:prepilin-type processing-associated H-X9-DG protein
LVIAIINLLVITLLPAVNAARESARSVQCRNNIRQLALGAIQHHDTHSRFPSGGWGYGWAGDPDAGGHLQPGGWCYSILPFIEEAPIRQLGRGASRETKQDLIAQAHSTPVELFYCPSRRGGGVFPYRSPKPENSSIIDRAVKCDYAANGGDVVVGLGWGPKLDGITRFKWPDSSEATGILHPRSRVRLVHLRDGTTKTYLLGEKYVSSDHYFDGNDLGDDQTAYTGFDLDTLRWASEEIRLTHDSAIPMGRPLQFGSAHPGGCHFALCDGSVMTVVYDVDARVHRGFANRRDGR